MARMKRLIIADSHVGQGADDANAMSSLLRVAGDLLGQMDVRRWGGLLNEISILLFLAMLIVTLARQSRAPGKRG